VRNREDRPKLHIVLPSVEDGSAETDAISKRAAKRVRSVFLPTWLSLTKAKESSQKAHWQKKREKAKAKKVARDTVEGATKVERDNDDADSESEEDLDVKPKPKPKAMPKFESEKLKRIPRTQSDSPPKKRIKTSAPPSAAAKRWENSKSQKTASASTPKRLKVGKKMKIKS